MKTAFAAAAAFVIVAVACGGSDEGTTTSSDVICNGEGLTKNAEVTTYCGCPAAYLSCPNVGALVGKDQCLCVAAGGTCGADIEGAFLCGAGSDVFRCTAGKLEPAFSCPDGLACIDVRTHDSVRCGTEDRATSYAVLGQPCLLESAGSCTADGKQAVQCRSGAWTVGFGCNDGTTCALVPNGTPGVGAVADGGTEGADGGVSCGGGAAQCYACIPR